MNRQLKSKWVCLNCTMPHAMCQMGRGPAVCRSSDPADVVEVEPNMVALSGPVDVRGDLKEKLVRTRARVSPVLVKAFALSCFVNRFIADPDWEFGVLRRTLMIEILENKEFPPFAVRGQVDEVLDKLVRDRSLIEKQHPVVPGLFWSEISLNWVFRVATSCVNEELASAEQVSELAKAQLTGHSSLVRHN